MDTVQHTIQAHNFTGQVKTGNLVLARSFDDLRFNRACTQRKKRNESGTMLKKRLAFFDTQPFLDELIELGDFT
jgi:hypothetical protein